MFPVATRIGLVQLRTHTVRPITRILTTVSTHRLHQHCTPRDIKPITKSTTHIIGTMSSRNIGSKSTNESEIELDTDEAKKAQRDQDALIEADSRMWWTISGLSGGLAVALGAFGAHGLKARVTDTYYLDIWQTAYQYHMAHTLAIAAAPIIVATMHRYRARTGQGVWSALRSNLFGEPAGLASTARAASTKRVTKYRNWSARCFLFGTVCFSGSLYCLTLTENKKFGAIAPIGGTAIIAGWILLALGL